MKKYYLLTLLLFFIAFIAGAQVTTNFSGTLNTSQVYTRPDLVVDNPGDPNNYTRQLLPADLKAGSGTYNYYFQSFIPAVSGVYSSIRVNSANLTLDDNGNIDDTYLYIYSGNFVPSSPLTNIIRANDDETNLTLRSAVTNVTLTAGQTYYLVLTSFTVNQTGTLDFTITGPGSVAVGQTTVSSITRASANPSSQSTVNYTATFAGAVSGVDASDFTLVPLTGTATGTVGTPTGSGNIWTVPVNSITGDGTFKLNFTGLSGVMPNVTTTYTTGEVYTIDRTAPTISTVTSTASNGTYVLGNTIPITVAFSENVTVTGTPVIALNSGGTASYASGSGTSTLTFNYVVGSGQSAADLDYTTTTALSLAGGTIRDAAANNASLILPTVGGANSIGGQKNIVVDGLPPTITSVAVPANATYRTGQNLDFTLNLSEAVTVNTGGGIPYIGITLNTGGAVQATYLSGSGTAALSFRYTVAAGNEDNDGIVLAGTTTLNGGTIRDAAGNDLSLTLSGVGSTTAILIDGIAPAANSINRVSAASTNASSVDYTLSFSENVTGVDISDFTLTTTGTAAGTVASVSPVSASVYTVNINTITGTGTLRLDLKNTGTGIMDAATNAITTGYTSGQVYTIDRVAPVIATVAVPANAVYSAGQNLDFTLNFNEPVTVTGAPQLGLTLNSGAVLATYLSGSGSSSLIFRYTVVTGNIDNDGILLDAAAALNGGTIQDALTNNATLTLNGVPSTSGILIDAVAPTITSVGVPANATYGTAQNLDFTVTLSEPVTVNAGAGNPYIGLNLNTGGTVQAAYLSGSGSSALTFRYTVTAGNMDNDGIVLASTVTLNGGTIKDAAGNNLTLALASVGSTAAVNVDGTAPSVNTIARVGGAGVTNAASVDYTVTFSENVTGFDTGDLSLTSSGTAAGTLAAVTPVSASVYTITVNALSGAGTLRLDLNNTGTGITDIANNAISAGFTAGEVYTIDRVVPVITSVAVPASATWLAGQNLDFSLNFNKAVTVTGTPQLALTLNTGGTVQAAYLSGSGSNALVFRYTVNTGDLDNDGISLAAAATLNGGSIRDNATNDAGLTLSGVPPTAGILIDAVVPVITSVNVPANATYGIGQHLDFTVNLTENIILNTAGGIPSLDLTLNTGGTVQASYLSGNNTNALTFRYTVAAGNADNDGIVLATAIALNGGTVKDAAGNNLSTALQNAGSTAAVNVDGTAPAVNAIARAGGAGTTNAASVDYTVTFSENISGFDISDLSLTTTGTAAGTVAAISPVSGSVYTVSVNTITGAGTLRLDLKNTGTGIIDAGANPISGGFTAGEAYTIDRIIPALTAVNILSNNAQPTKAKAGDIITLTFTSAETIQTPVLTINGNAPTSLTSTGNNWTATYMLTANDTEGLVPFNISFTDLANNAGVPVTAGTGSVLFDRTPPATPGGLAAVSGDTQIQLSWNAGTDADLASYRILSGTSPEPTAVLSNIPAGTTSYTHTGLSNGVAYYYKIQAFDQTGNSSAASADVTAIPKANQVITFNPVTAKTYGDADFILGAVNSSAALPVTYTAADPAIVLITGNTAKILKSGSTTITATQEGNSSFNPAATVQRALTVNQKDLVIVNNNRSKVYGSTLGNTDFSGSITGVVNNDNITVSRSSTGAAAAAVVGTYPVSATLADPDSKLSNYNLSNPTALLTVTQKPLTITASNQTKTYGDALTFTGTEFTSLGLVNGDLISSLSISSPGATATATVAGSPYVIIPASAAGAGLSNYTLAYVNGTLTVNQKGLVITADNKEKFAGTANPPLTASFSGLVNGETRTVLTAQPVLSTTAIQSSPIGNYPITAGSAAAANYVISYVNGALSVKAAAPTDISLSLSAFYENQPSGTNAGLLSATSDDPAATFSYSLIGGSGDTDNSLFSISGTNVLSTASLNYEQKAVYSIRVRVTTQYGFTLDKAFSINLSDVNEIPALDAVTNQVLCYTSAKQDISLTGISSGPETAQTTTVTAISSTDLIQNISVTKNGAANATLSYRIKDGAAGTATITVTVKDNGGTANGGTDTYTRSFTITVNALPVIAITANLGTEISKGKTVLLTATGGTSYSWATGNGIISGQQTATLTVRPSITTTYTVTVTNASGCTEQKTITLNVLDDYKTLDATNIVTPNGDGQNDFWLIRNIDLYPNNEVKVFDKAGRIVFSQKHYQNTWDATVNGSPLSEGTYYYIVDFGEGKGRLKGFITIIRRQ